jgi:hypothetical protein
MTEEILSKEEILKARKEVEVEVSQEAKDRELELLKASERKKIRARAHLDEPVESILIDLPDSSLDIKLDGVAYVNGVTYPVRKAVADTMREIMFRSWQHEAEINGKRKNFFTQRNTILSPSGVRNAPTLGLRV